jgi:hypothetical protein
MPCVYIEAQNGEYPGEEDVVRFDDDLKKGEPFRKKRLNPERIDKIFLQLE